MWQVTFGMKTKSNKKKAAVKEIKAKKERKVTFLGIRNISFSSRWNKSDAVGAHNVEINRQGMLKGRGRKSTALWTRKGN